MTTTLRRIAARNLVVGDRIIVNNFGTTVLGVAKGVQPWGSPVIRLTLAGMKSQVTMTPNRMVDCG